jgi:regulatory protein
VANATGRASAANIRHAAIDLLARREHSYQELLAKLGRRFDDRALIEVQLDQLVSSDLQSDQRFCESFVRSRSLSQGHGPRRIAQDLRQRGVSDSLIREYLWDAADIDWTALLQQLYRKRYGDSQPVDYQEKAKRMRFLQYRGFDYELIRQVLRVD